jgi:hypothetical protein
VLHLQGGRGMLILAFTLGAMIFVAIVAAFIALLFNL